jgi:serine/threonine protein kinase
MPDAFDADNDFDLSAAKRRDLLCDTFEANLKAGHEPLIEDELLKVPEGDRALLFLDLLKIEIEQRRPGLDGYPARFPEYAHLINLPVLDPGRTVADETRGVPDPPKIPGYEVSGPPIGTGGMGAVFKGRDVSLGRPVAVKVLQPGAPLDRFEVEAQAIGRLNHSNVVTVHRYGFDKERPFLVLEYVDGGSLDRQLRAGPLGPVRAAELVKQLARAMQVVHETGIVHRDLKPANVLLTAEGTPKITDFGLAKRHDVNTGITGAWAVLGTPCYMSPEQARGKTEEVGRSADIWALGGILYACLTGGPPFSAETADLTIRQVISDDPVRPGELVDGLSADLEAVCLKCLEKEPARRYASAADLADDLHRWQAGDSTEARPLTTAERHARWASKAGFKLDGPAVESAGAVTYRARQESIGRVVWVRFPTDSSANVTVRREAVILAGIHHPNVIRLLDCREQADHPYLVLEAVDGRPLTDRRPEPMVTLGVIQLGLMLALGIRAVHETGQVHGGVWTGAVFLGPCEVPVIAALGPPPVSAPAGFVAPEVRTGGLPDVRSDLFSFGAVLYDLAIGQPPGDRPWPVPDRQLDRIIARCLAADPTGRYETTASLLLDLQFLEKELREESVTIGPAGAPVSTGTDQYGLRVVDGPQLAGQSFAIPRLPLRIGRDEESDVHLPDRSRRVSREHCVVVWDPGAAAHVVIDLESHNHTFVNGHQIPGRRQLVAGDKIGIGPYKLVFERVAGPDG